jgi:hypothetical protein
MHLFFFLKQRNPGISFRLLIALSQGIFFNLYFLFYTICPSHCHRFVGYLEEEAVYTYTVLLECMDDGRLPQFAAMKAPQEAIEYYNLPKDAMFRDMVLAIRADEACHREVNHYFSEVPHWAEVDAHIIEMKIEAKLALKEE